MGSCLSNATKVIGYSSSRGCSTAADAPRQQRENNIPRSETTANRREKQKEKDLERRTAGIVPCGKRTNFGYGWDFQIRYNMGKLLGRGQFGYTFVATDKATGEKVAVKRIDKNKVNSLSLGFFGILRVYS